MTPEMIALLLQAGGTAIGGIASGASKIDLLSPEQKASMKELERKEALGLLGLSQGEQQNILNQRLQPIRGSQQQMIEQFKQGQTVGDIGQGSAFRQQKAQQEAYGNVMQQATADAQAELQSLDQLAQARQMAQLQGYKAQRRQNISALGEMFGGVAEAGSQVADAKAFEKQMKMYENFFNTGTKEVAKNNTANTNLGQELTDALLSQNIPQEQQQQIVSNAQTLAQQAIGTPIVNVTNENANQQLKQDLINRGASQTEIDNILKVYGKPEQVTSSFTDLGNVDLSNFQQMDIETPRENLLSGLTQTITGRINGINYNIQPMYSSQGFLTGYYLHHPSDMQQNKVINIAEESSKGNFNTLRQIQRIMGSDFQ